MATTLLMYDAASLDSDTLPVVSGDKAAYYDALQGRMVVVYPDGADEYAAITRAVEMPSAYAGGALTANLGIISGATAGSVRWEVYVEAVTPGDAVDLDAATSFDNANGATSAVPATAGYLSLVSIPLTSADNVAAGDMVRFLVRRDADLAADDAAASAYLLWLAVEEA